MIQVASQHELLPNRTAHSLREVTGLANRAVHGEHIRSEDALAVAELGVELIDVLRWTHAETVLAPLSSETITQQELEAFRRAKYKVISVIPMVKNPTKETRILDQDGLDQLLEGYDEYAEFIVSVETIER